MSGSLRRWGKLGSIGLVVVVALSGISATPASAAPNFSIIVSKDESIVVSEGFPVGAAVAVQVVRNGVAIANATGLAADLLGTGVGMFEVNHLAQPTECWDDFTPEILAGDLVRVTSGGVTDTVTVADIEVTEGATRIDGDTGTVKGRIVATPLPDIDTLSVETRSIAPTRFRAFAPWPNPPAGVTGTLAYDTEPGALPGSFTATFEGFDPEQMAAFLDSFEVSAMFAEATTAGGDLSATAATFGATAGSEDPLCPPTARRAVTTLSESMVNLANQEAALAITGVSVEATAVTATVTDRNGLTRTAPAATLSGTGVSQTWQTSLAAGDLVGLADGPLTVAASYTETGGPQHGATRTIQKDTVAPAAPTISPNGGSFTGSRQVNIIAPGADIMYTLDGTTPGLLNGVPFGRPITLSDTATLRAVAIDAFGNVGPVARADFTALTPSNPSTPVPTTPVPTTPVPTTPSVVAKAPAAPKIGRARSGAVGSRVTATARWAAPTDDGGSDVTTYVLTALRIVDGKVVRRTTITVPGTARSAQVKLRRGSYKFQLKAVNAVGSSTLSARSNLVRAR